MLFDLILNKMDDECLDDMINKIKEDNKIDKVHENGKDFKMELRKMIWNDFNFLNVPFGGGEY